MKRFTSNDEIEDLCEAMIKDFFKSKHYANVMCVDILASAVLTQEERPFQTPFLASAHKSCSGGFF